jgi:hypothetical protein
LKHRHPPTGLSRRLSQSIRRASRTLPSGCAARGMCGAASSMAAYPQRRLTPCPARSSPSRHRPSCARACARGQERPKCCAGAN